MPDYSVKLFASVRERLGRDTLNLHVPQGGTVGLLRRELERSAPELAALFSRSALAVNRRYARDEEPLREGDEVAVIPPVAGG